MKLNLDDCYFYLKCVVPDISKSRSSNHPAFTYLKLKEGFMDLLKSRELSIYNRLYVEYQVSPPYLLKINCNFLSMIVLSKWHYGEDHIF